MKEVKLFNLLKSISKNEFIELRNFIESPVFNSNKTLVSMYDYLYKNYDKVINTEVSKFDLYKSVFGSEIFHESKYWKITSAFSSVIDRYLIYNEFLKDSYYQKNLLLEVYRTRNIQKQFASLSKEIQKSFEMEFNKGLNFFLNQTHYYFQNISYLGTGDNHDLDSEIEKLFENLRMFFIMTNITSVSIISNLKKEFIDNSTSKLWLFDDIMDYLYKKKSYIKKNYLTVYIFYIIILSKIYPDEEKYYFEVKRIILRNREKYSSNLFRHMLINILDYSVNKLVKGEEKFLNEIFILNKMMNDNSLTLFGEYIQSDYYYSVIEHVTMLKKISWAKEFAEKYKHYLSVNDRESAVNLGLARITFENKDFNSSLQHLLKVENINPYFYLSHKILLIQNNYELGKFENISFIMETLSKYLKRRIDISKELKENYVKFLYYFRKLKTISTTKVYLINSLEKEMQAEKFFLQKKWMLEKINELNRKF
ncbi:MAG: hypothetical protein IPL53_09355 [Ignavibacteria bacterium]|nr:hypothetical protein [Ignavibacteria bacterium]